MKTTLDHLPEFKQAELRQIAGVILNLCDDIEIIVLFGSYARGDWKNAPDLTPNRKSGHPSDYDILAVTREKETVRNSLLWDKIHERFNTLGLSASARILVHDVKFIQERLNEVHYFFTDIVKEGCRLYDSGQYELIVKRELSYEEKYQIAIRHFEHWFTGAKEFFDDFNHNITLKRINKSAFYLHQAAESAYKAFLLVYTNYCPYEHFLYLLDRQACEILPSISEVFPRNTQKEADRFKQFDYAYIGARYDPDFKLLFEDLQYLSKRVRYLLEIIEILCKEKLESYIKNQ